MQDTPNTTYERLLTQLARLEDSGQNLRARLRTTEEILEACFMDLRQFRNALDIRDAQISAAKLEVIKAEAQAAAATK